MWTSLVLLGALAALPTQSGGLQISNVRFTMGPFGATIKSQVPELQTGDMFYVYYDVENLTVDELGTAKYTITMEITNSKGSAIFSDGPKDGEATLSLGGTRMPAFARALITKDQDPGEYTVKVTITDRNAKEKTKATTDMSRKFKIKKPEFGIVQPSLKLAGDQSVVDTPPFFAVGQTPLVHCYVGSFARKNDQPDLEISFVVLENDKPTTSKPAVQVIDKKVDPKQDFVEIWFPVDANRAGSFVIEMTAKDRIANKSEKIRFPITVQELK
jgi:hypothetical protein